MQDAVRVSVVHRLANGLQVSGRPRSGQRTVPHQLRQRAALDIFHRKVLLPVVLADLVDGHDVRMLQMGDRLGFGPEPLHHLGLGQLPGGEHQLDGDDAVQAFLVGLIDNAHAAARDDFQQLVVAKHTCPGEASVLCPLSSVFCPWPSFLCPLSSGPSSLQLQGAAKSAVRTHWPHRAGWQRLAANRTALFFRLHAVHRHCVLGK